ncbi:unnamed protein product, partial [Anisakis simplex]|uniref:CCHC-type domain-containing protein n=1 Tax=Anisakis simplex TaxID=6269 RepID=A0A0M3KFG9_ANISI
MDRLQAANPVVPPQASPTAHLRMTVEPYLNECTPLLDDADSYLQFHIDETLSSMEQISSLQQARRAASYACVLLKEKEQCLRTLFDEWKDIIRSLSPEDSEETVHSEYSSFQAMSVNPNGLRATLSHVNTIIHKLHFLDEDLHDLEDRIRSNLSPAPSRQLLQSPQLSATTTQQKAEPPIIQRQPSQVSTDAYVQSTHLPNTITARLPQLQLPTFDGKPGEWFEFWQLFEATVDIHPLANVEKFAYLTSCLRGQAKLVAAGYPRRAESYRPLIDALHQQFGNLDALERSLQVQLRQLRNPTHTSTDLKEFHNDVSRILNHMRIADIDTEQRQILFELEEHLPEATRLLMYSSKRKCVNYSTSDFLRILLETAQMLEAVQPLARFSSRSEHANQSIMPTRRNIPQLSMRSFASSSPNQTASSNKFRQQRFSNINQQPPPVNFSRQQQSTNLIRNSRQTPTVPCAFCNAAHWHSECRLYSTIQQRNNRARQLNLCFKCLKPGHTTLNCPRSRNCYYCHGPHNTVLCSMQATQRPAISHTHLAVAETIPNATSSNSAAVTTSQHNVIHPSTVLLLWGTTKTYNPILPQSLKTTRVFLDQGSQTTFVTERFAKSLGFSLNNKKPLIIHGVGDVDGNQYNSAKIFFGIRLADGSNHIVEASTLPKVTAKFLHASITPTDLPTLWNDMSSEFPLPLYEDEPDILIGSNFASVIDLHAIKQLRCGFTLYDSTIGPIVGGAGRIPTKYQHKYSNQANTVLVGSVPFFVANSDTNNYNNNKPPATSKGIIPSPNAQIAKESSTPPSITVLTPEQISKASIPITQG